MISRSNRGWLLSGVLGALLVLAPLNVSATEQQDARTGTKGKGPPFRSFISGIACADAIKSLEKKEGVNSVVLLVSSFISGTNYVKGRDSQIDLKAMLMITEKYCRDNPEEPVTNALIVLDKVIDQKLRQEKTGAQ